jgi:DNA polymerase elongation subunit (family B)
MRLWTPEEDGELRDLWDRGLPVEDIAKWLKRRKAIVRQRSRDLGLTRPNQPRMQNAVPGPRLLVVDIETMANLAWTWGTWKQNIAPIQVVKPKRTISWAAKWVGQPRVYFRSEWTPGGREAMVREIWKLVDEADAVVSYNGKRFDMKHLNSEFDKLRLGPPGEYQHIDLYTVGKREFMFNSYKLDEIARQRGIGTKREHEGFGLWLKVEAEDADARKRMEQYNTNDVILTERLFDDWRPWIPLRGRQSQKSIRRLLDASDR